MKIFNSGDVLPLIPTLMLKGKFSFEFEMPPYRAENINLQKAANFFVFDSHLLTESLQTVVYLDGYRQTEKYFTSIKNIIRNDFVFKDVPNEVNKNEAT